MEPATDNPSTTVTPTPTTGLPLRPGNWTLDQAHARIGFSVRHLGISKVRGYFAEVDADLVVGVTASDTTVAASIDMASIDTGSAARDASVRSDTFLGVEQRPTMTFRSTGLGRSGEDWTLDGELTIGDVTAPISLAIEFGGVAESFDGSRHAGFAATGKLHRKDFGLSFGPADPVVGEVVDLELDLEFVEP